MNARTARVLRFFRLSIPVSGLLFLLGATGCKVKQARNSEADRATAEGVARRFYEVQRNGDYEKAEPLWSKSSREKRPAKARVELLQRVEERFGTEKEITIESWEARHVNMGHSDADSYDLVYQVIRSNRITREAIGLVLDGDSIRIHSYKVDADGTVISY